MSATQNLGKVGFLLRGDWSATVSDYTAMDVVLYEGTSYYAKDSIPTGTLPTDTTYWGVLASKGEKGEKGDPGTPEEITWDSIINKPFSTIGTGLKVEDDVISFENSAGFITNAVEDLINYYTKSETYTKTEVDSLIAGIKQFEFVIADELPEASEETMYKIYLIPAPDAKSGDSKDEFITIRSGEEGSYIYTWEQIGSTRIDLSNYYTKSETDEKLETKQNILTASDGIDINENIISVKVDNETVKINEDGQISASGKNAYNSINQIADYLFEVQYSTENIDYDYANEYFKTGDFSHNSVGACTGVVKGNEVLRHFDWYYDNTCEFIIRRPADPENNIHASIGTATTITKLSKSFVESGKYSPEFKALPFLTVDGINDAGLYIQINVVPSLENGFDINPEAEIECSDIMLVRYMLDHCASIEEAEQVFNTVHIYPRNGFPYCLHYLIVKDGEWVIVELTEDSHITITEGTSTNQIPYGIMTNFRMSGLSFIEDNHIDWSTIEQYGNGVERYEIAESAFTDDISLADISEDLTYTHVYTNTELGTRWNTECCGMVGPSGDKLTILDAKNSPNLFDEIFIIGAQMYANRDRNAENPDTWQSVHRAIYDLSNKSFKIYIQERPEEFNFNLQEIRNITVSAHESEQATVTKTIIDDTVNLDFGLPKGEQGEKGEQGDPGIQGEPGPKGDPGNTLFATFAIDFETGNLIETVPEGYSGIEFSINSNGCLEVEINGNN